jgi:hypothetical protein
MDSVIRSKTEVTGPIDLGTVNIPFNEEKDGLERFGGRKWLMGMFIILIASIFTGMLLMSIEQWLMVAGAVGGSYYGVNFMQKKML